MEFDKSNILTCITTDQAKVGMKGWFASSITGLEIIMKESKPRTLIRIRKDTLYVFENVVGYYALFYPAPEQTYEERQAEWVKETGIKDGDKVRVTRKVKEHEDDWDSSWTEEMDEYVGCIGTVGITATGSVRVNFSDDFWYFPYYVLEQVKETYREYTNEEMNNLVGKVITSHVTGNNRLVSERIGPKLVRVGSDIYSAKDLLEGYTINGERCGVKE